MNTTSAATCCRSIRQNARGNSSCRILKPVADAQTFQIAADRVRRRRRVFHEIDFLGSATQRLDPHRARSRKQIEPYAALERRRIPRRQHVE